MAFDAMYEELQQNYGIDPDSIIVLDEHRLINVSGGFYEIYFHVKGNPNLYIANYNFGGKKIYISQKVNGCVDIIYSIEK